MIILFEHDVLNGAYRKTEKNERQRDRKMKRDDEVVADDGVSNFYREPRVAARLSSPFNLTLVTRLVYLSSPRPCASLFFSLIICTNYCEKERDKKYAIRLKN